MRPVLMSEDRLTGATLAFIGEQSENDPQRFRAKWMPVRVKKTRQTKDQSLGSDSIRTEKALKRDEIGLNRHRTLALCLSMIFSENRYTLFRIML
jgi:hypothetical protein